MLQMVAVLNKVSNKMQKSSKIDFILKLFYNKLYRDFNMKPIFSNMDMNYILWDDRTRSRNFLEDEEDKGRITENIKGTQYFARYHSSLRL